MATAYKDHFKYDNQDELIEDVVHNECVTFRLNESTYFMGATYYEVRQIGICPDGESTVFHSAEDQLNFVIDGKPLRDHWRDMELLN